MKRLCGSISILVAVLTLQRSSLAQCQLEIEDEPQGIWNDINNWDCGRIPTSTDAVTIPYGKTAIIQNYAADAKQLTTGVDPGSGLQGAVLVRRGGKLTLHGTSGQTTESTLNGTIRFEDRLCGPFEDCDDPELIIKNSHTFKRTSNDGLYVAIVGADNLRDQGENGYGVIRGYDSSAQLSFVKLENPERLVRAFGNLEFRVGLDNNGEINAIPQNESTHVAKILLNTVEKTGSGIWKATHGDLYVQIGVTGYSLWESGTMAHIYVNAVVTCNSSPGDPGMWHAINDGQIIVDASVSGSAPWVAEQRLEVGYPIILIKKPCTTLTGDVILHAGLMKFDDDFCTIGELVADGGRALSDSDQVTVTFSRVCSSP